MHLLRAATLVTPNPEATAALYATWFDYRVVEQGTVPAELAEAWGAAASAGRRYVVCQPASGRNIFLRFVAGAPPAAYRPLTSFGWAAIELCVQDVLAVERQLAASPFEIIGRPKRLDGLPMVFAMQVKGPDGEIVFLTEITDEVPGMELPRASAPVDSLFIAVLACSDMAASAAWFEQTLRLAGSPPLDLAYEVLSEAFGLPVSHKHTIATLGHGRDVFLEIDRYPDGATARPCVPDALPPGIAAVTLHHPEFATLDAPWVIPPVARDDVLYQGRQVGVLRAPDGILVEIVAAD